MDETEKYKQRLEAIAERRRLQEEQDKARREMEDERLRVQQLKRKSLRDQWLMEGAPLSPTSLDTLSPRSPLWSSQAPDIDQDMDNSQSESHQLVDEKEKLKDQMESGQMKIVKMAEVGEEISQDDVMQNGENCAGESETSEDSVKTNQSPLLNETAVVLTNGSEDLSANTNHSASKSSTQSTTNGPMCSPEGVDSMLLEPGLNLGFFEAEAAQVTNVTFNEGKEEGTVVMRAERVIITDEGDDVSENLTPQEGQPETIQSEESPLPKAEVSEQEEEAVEGDLKTEEALETFTQPEKNEATELTTEAQPVNGDGDTEGDIKIHDDGDTKPDGQDKQSEDSTFLQLQSTATVPEDATVASVPVYSETQTSSLSPEARGEGEGEAAVAPEGAEAAIKVQDQATVPGQFQEVPLTDAQENQRTEASVGEQEPLLLQSKAHNTQAAAVATNSPASAETRNSAGTLQEEETKTPNRKTCQCCSIM